MTSLRALIDQATAQRDIADSSDMAAWELLGVLRLETADLLDRAMGEVKAYYEDDDWRNETTEDLLAEFAVLLASLQPGLLSTNQEGTENECLTWRTSP